MLRGVELPAKVCPRCREEYLRTAESCSDCEVPLVFADQLGREEPELPEVAQLEAVRFASASWAVRLSERLVEAGIPHRVAEVAGQKTGAYGIFVRSEDLEAAREVDASHLAREMPDLPAEAAEPGSEVEGCPACGADAPPDADECPGCGLALLGA